MPYNHKPVRVAVSLPNALEQPRAQAEDFSLSQPFRIQGKSGGTRGGDGQSRGIKAARGSQFVGSSSAGPSWMSDLLVGRNIVREARIQKSGAYRRVDMPNYSIHPWSHSLIPFKAAAERYASRRCTPGKRARNEDKPKSRTVETFARWMSSTGQMLSYLSFRTLRSGGGCP